MIMDFIIAKSIDLVVTTFGFAYPQNYASLLSITCNHPSLENVRFQSKIFLCCGSWAKDDKKDKTFDALEWLAAMCSHVPNRGEQMVRYYGYYSNLCRGKREKQNKDDLIPCVLEPYSSSKEYRKNWARLIQKIYEVDPLTCPKCSGEMKVISIIEDEEVIKKILKHLGLPSCLKPQVEFAYDCGIGE
jgi:hypothetical protein